MGERKQQRVSAAKRKKAEAEVQAFVDRFFAAVDDGWKYTPRWYAPPWPASELALPTQIIINQDWAADHGLEP